MASSLARPPALRITCASPSAKPANFAGSNRASIHVRIANRLAGGIASLPFSVNSALYFAFDSSTSVSILLICDYLLTLKCTARMIRKATTNKRKSGDVKTLSAFNKKDEHEKRWRSAYPQTKQGA